MVFKPNSNYYLSLTIVKKTPGCHAASIYCLNNKGGNFCYAYFTL